MLEPSRRGGSNEYPESMVWIKNTKTKLYVSPCKSHFYYINLGSRGYTCRVHVFLMAPNTPFNHAYKCIY